MLDSRARACVACSDRATAFGAASAITDPVPVERDPVARPELVEEAQAVAAPGRPTRLRAPSRRVRPSHSSGRASTVAVSPSTSTTRPGVIRQLSSTRSGSVASPSEAGQPTDRRRTHGSRGAARRPGSRSSAAPRRRPRAAGSARRVGRPAWSSPLARAAGSRSSRPRLHGGRAGRRCRSRPRSAPVGPRALEAWASWTSPPSETPASPYSSSVRFSSAPQ